MDFPALQGKGVIGHFDIYLASGLSTTLNCSKDLWFIPAVWIEAAWDGSARSGTWSKVEFSIVWYSLYNFASLNQCPQAHQLKEQFLICCLPPFFFFSTWKSRNDMLPFTVLFQCWTECIYVFMRQLDVTLYFRKECRTYNFTNLLTWSPKSLHSSCSGPNLFRLLFLCT